MVFNLRAGRALAAAAAAVAIAVTGCNAEGGNMTTGEQKVPFTQVRDHIYQMYQRTLQELPQGYRLHDERYGASMTIVKCSDDPSTPAPSNMADYRDLAVPADTDAQTVVDKVSAIWRGFGWRMTREGVDNVAYAPDGYRVSVGLSGSWVTVVGTSPCLWRDETTPVRTACSITADSIDYDCTKSPQGGL